MVLGVLVVLGIWRCGGSPQGPGRNKLLQPKIVVRQPVSTIKDGRLFRQEQSPKMNASSRSSNNSSNSSNHSSSSSGSSGNSSSSSSNPPTQLAWDHGRVRVLPLPISLEPLSLKALKP